MSDYDQSPNYQRGLNLVKEMLGDRFLAGLTASAESGAFAADCASIAIESAFGAVWSRPGLARRDRSLVTLGILIASGKSAELRNHVRAGLNNGLGVEELQEVMIQAFPYCGFPCVAEAIEATIAVLRERGLIDDSTQSAKERGLL
ncbi:carboxymuconolactone decarboxylase family protein [Piscinibacter sp. XHJ-5]|uniref:carboxymuconolactone decarboxylase family protein n=1 Tax=Piscinibacter sp. XHJ-5 TaxID=3037797 RepID=UPI00245354D7|nr:carboxymuconolactone decarboxylase family protein [Piscinibacter sp. XHJ-5]